MTCQACYRVGELAFLKSRFVYGAYEFMASISKRIRMPFWWKEQDHSFLGEILLYRLYGRNQVTIPTNQDCGIVQIVHGIRNKVYSKIDI